MLLTETDVVCVGHPTTRLSSGCLNTLWHSYKFATSVGAAATGIPSSQQFIPCYDGLDCSTFSLPHGNYSVIAGHFTWRELERVHLQDFACVVTVRQPRDRVISCLSYFYPRAIMESVHTMSRYVYSLTLAFC